MVNRKKIFVVFPFSLCFLAFKYGIDHFFTRVPKPFRRKSGGPFSLCSIPLWFPMLSFKLQLSNLNQKLRQGPRAMFISPDNSTEKTKKRNNKLKEIKKAVYDLNMHWRFSLRKFTAQLSKGETMYPGSGASSDSACSILILVYKIICAISRNRLEMR